MSSLPMEAVRTFPSNETGWVEIDATPDVVTEDEYAAVEGDFVALEPVVDVDEAFAAMLEAQETPLVQSQADADALHELLRRSPPARRALPPPLPLDE
jgi:hypothetical protein